ncbi:MAG: hypothetical protein IPK50_22855 [Fibrobacterota bacterium]|nr:hypothetical protein [Fibrobacterota bacterium]QQS05083.1 MAG: hypothetical protein IPK50_22855 [Fibrobacterota bacterium]
MKHKPLDRHDRHEEQDDRRRVSPKGILKLIETLRRTEWFSSAPISRRVETLEEEVCKDRQSQGVLEGPSHFPNFI